VIRPGNAAVLLLVMLASCRIEQTPPEYIDSTRPTEREQAREEVRSRLLAAASAYERGDVESAVAALGLTGETHVIAPGVEGDVGGDEALRAFGRDRRTPSTLDVRNLDVRVGPRGGVAWFHGAATTNAGEFRVTGVLLRAEGSWRLSQAHISRPVEPDTVSGAGAGM
jgi:hypothetical protein